MALPSPTFADHRSALRRLSVDGGRIAYLDLGPSDAPPLLLLHGIPTSSWLYRRIAARTAAEGLRTVVPDLLGFGASDKPTDLEVYSLERQADRLAALLDHLAVDRVTLVTHDAGGPWGFELLDRHPERIGGLVLLNTTAYADAFTPPREVRALGGPFGPAMLALMRSPLGKAMVHRMLSRLTHAGAALDRSATRPYWQALNEGGTVALRAFSQGLDHMLAQFPRYSAALAAAATRMPAILIWGTGDPVLTSDRLVPRFSADLGLRSADVHLLAGASHFLQEDRPDEIAELIFRFVRERVERGGA
jgi:pimeloyl-ACP methyl ester carboxylesterase